MMPEDKVRTKEERNQEEYDEKSSNFEEATKRWNKAMTDEGEDPEKMKNNEGYNWKRPKGIFSFVYESEYTKENVMKMRSYSSVRSTRGKFEKDVLMTGLLAASLGYGSGKFFEKIVGKDALGPIKKIILALVAGVAIENLEYQNSTTTVTADVGNWYGKIRWNERTGITVAQDYYGFEKEYTTVLQIIQTHRIIDKTTGRVLVGSNIFGSEILQNPNAATNPAQSLPLKDFGSFD
jgi:hypothetical protein